jgi:hypothetical protein
MLYMGTGGSFSPHTPLIDAMMGKRLQARGFAGTRDETICLYGSLSKDHALEYARDEQESYLKILEPQAGAVVSWVPGSRDLLLRFSTHLGELRWRGVDRHNGVKFGSLVRDISGDVDIAETYLRLGRQKRAIAAILDHFLDGIEVCEHRVDGTQDLADVLSGHTGEIWITGPCLVSAYESVCEMAP